MGLDKLGGRVYKELMQNWQTSLITWLHRNDRSQEWFARKLGITGSYLSYLLDDKRVLSEELQQRVNAIMEQWDTVVTPTV